MKKLSYILLFLLAFSPDKVFAGGFNGSGTYIRFYNWQNDKANGIDITASRFDQEDNGFATGLSTTLTKDGQQTATARIPFALGLSFAGSSGLAPVGDLTTGIFQTGAAGTIQIQSEGTGIATFDSTGLDGTVIGQTTPAAGTFTTLTANSTLSILSLSFTTTTATAPAVGAYSNAANALTLTATGGGSIFLQPGSSGAVQVNATTNNAALYLNANTTSMILPVGTTGQRPATDTGGMLRFNSTIPAVEAYYNNGWSTINSQVICGGSGPNSITSNNTDYFWAGGTFVGGAGIGGGTGTAPFSGTLKNLYITANTNAGTGNTTTFTLYVNGSSTSVTCNFTGNSAQTCNDTTHSAAVATAQTMAIQAAQSTSASANVFGFCIELDH